MEGRKKGRKEWYSRKDGRMVGMFEWKGGRKGGHRRKEERL
jgi:hypothetical protein